MFRISESIAMAKRREPRGSPCWTPQFQLVKEEYEREEREVERTSEGEE